MQILHCLPFRINHKLKAQVSSSHKSEDYGFWNPIRTKYIAQIYRTYRLDFEMFQYCPFEYLKKHGMTEKAKELRSILQGHLPNS